MTTVGGMNLDDLIAEFGAVYEDNGQTDKDFKRALFYDDDLTPIFKKVPFSGTIYKGIQITTTEVLQGFLKAFVSKGTSQFDVWKQRVGAFKIDKLEDPDDYVDQFTGFLTDLKEVDRSKWPLIKYIISEILIPQSKQDTIKEVNYWGYQLTGVATEAVNANGLVRTTSAANNKLKANTAMDGLRVQFVKMAAAGRLNTITMGTWPTDPTLFVEAVEDWVAQIPELLAKNIDFVNMSAVLHRRYRQGRREKYNVNYAQVSELDAIEDYPGLIVRPNNSQIGSNKIWATPANNRVNAVRADVNQKFDVQKADRSVKMMTNWNHVLTFNQPELIVVSEHENTIVSGEITSTGRYATTVITE